MRERQADFEDPEVGFITPQTGKPKCFTSKCCGEIAKEI